MKTQEQYQAEAGPSFFERAYQKASESLGKDRVNPRDCIELYSAEEISEDERLVTKLEKQFTEGETPSKVEAKKAADILEAIMHEQIELSDWFGPLADTVECSKFDDYVNGVDLVVEFNGEDEAKRLALAIDVTYSNAPDVLTRKLARIKKEIDENRMAAVKYFISGITDEAKPEKLPMLPHAVIAVSKEMLDSLANKWVTESPRALANHRVQYQILKEILLELGVFYHYAKIKNRPEIATTIRASIIQVDEIYKEKMKTALPGAEVGDNVFKTLINILNKFDQI